MAFLNIGNGSVASALAELREQRKKIDQAIAALEALQGIDTPVSEIVEDGSVPRVRVRARSASYAHLNLIDAAKAHLSQHGKQSTQQITDALIKGGFPTESDNFRNVVSTMLHRYANDPSTGLASAGRALWLYDPDRDH